MKKITLFLFTLLVGLLVLGSFNVKASSTITLTNGAQVRTAGEFQGLRFAASVDTLEGSTDHGFFLALGEHSLSDMTTAINAEAATVGANKLVKKSTTGEDLEFAVTVYDITNTYYTTGITAVAYVYNGSTYTLSDIKVTRSIAEVAMAALNAGRTGTILTNVATYLDNNYMVKSTSLNQFGEFTITHLVTQKYSYSDLTDLFADFVADYNGAITSPKITTSTSASDFYASLATGIENNDVLNLTGSNIAKFFSGANFTKWSWLLDYFAANGVNSHVKNQANGLLNANRICPSGKAYKTVHLSTSIYNFFKQASETNGYSANSFSAGESAYSSITWPSVTDFASSNVVRIGSSIELPNAIVKNGYDFVKYNDGTSDYLEGDDYTIVNTPVVIKASYTPIEYTITYNLDGGTNALGNPSSYDIETAVALQNPTKDGYMFSGWYNNGEFTGDTISSIPKGSTGNVNLYAKWSDPVPLELSVGAADVAVLNEVTPNIIVKADLEGRYYLSGVGLDDSYSSKYYTINSSAFTTIADALTNANDNDIIYVFAGTYTNALTVSHSGIQIIGPNYNIKGYAARETEAVVTGRVDITAENVTINGMKFDSAGNIYTTAEHTTIEYIYSTSTPTNLVSGYDSRYTQLGGKDSKYLIVRNCWFNAAISADQTYRGSIVLAGELTDVAIYDNKISSTAPSSKNQEVIMIYNVVGTLTIKHNVIDALTSGYSIRIYSGYYTSDKYATEINIVNNVITGTSVDLYSSGIQARQLATKAAVTLNVVGNDFEYVKGNTFNFDGSTASATINIKYNYFQYAYKLSTPGSGVINYLKNYYESAQTTATSDVEAIADKATLISQYKASGEFTTFGSVCVYEN